MNLKNKDGFSLIELMIALFIMGALTTLVSTSIQSSIKNKKKLESRIHATAAMYDTIRIIKFDVEKAFHYQDVFYEIEKRALDNLNKALKKKKNKNNAQTPSREPYKIPPRPRKLTQFLGEEDSIHFTSLNNFRTQYNAPESDQMEVGYFVDSCQARRDQKQTQCLFRRTSPYIDDEVDDGGRRMVLAEYVTEFKLKYRSDREDDEWVEQWRSDNKGRADHQNRFPHQVEVTLVIHDEDNKYGAKLKETTVMNIQFPNNTPFFPPERNQRGTNTR